MSVYRHRTRHVHLCFHELWPSKSYDNISLYSEGMTTDDGTHVLISLWLGHVLLLVIYPTPITMVLQIRWYALAHTPHTGILVLQIRGDTCSADMSWHLLYLRLQIWSYLCRDRIYRHTWFTYSLSLSLLGRSGFLIIPVTRSQNHWYEPNGLCCHPNTIPLHIR
jgi:hypothetical protein